METKGTPPHSLWAETLLLPALLAIGSFTAVLTLSPSSSSGLIAAVFPPWWSESRALLAAAEAGSVVGIGRLPFVVVVAAENTALIQQLRRSGAWLILDPRAALGGCVAPVSFKKENELG